MRWLVENSPVANHFRLSFAAMVAGCCVSRIQGFHVSGAEGSLSWENEWGGGLGGALAVYDRKM